jgi:hypothetical protein
MIKPLRKRHLQIWGLLGFLIPLGIISGYMAIPKQAYTKLLQDDTATALPVVCNKIERKNYAVYLRSDAEKINYQLQWINKTVSAIPSSLLYKTNNNDKELIGRVASTGSCFFPLKTDSTNAYQFVLYDIVHQQIIDTINFKK